MIDCKHKKGFERKKKSVSVSPKYIALYLPQFHTFKENDEWWGKGFTEWTNVKVGEPYFEGHYQPHIPHPDIGYYDLSDDQVMVKQAKMAKEYGVYGFSYYFYWFNGKKLMEKPLENMLKNKDIDIPFCLFWANHNWTRAWDVGNKEVLIEQTYDEATYSRFIDDLMPYFKDDRYIKVDGKPMLLIYQADVLPDPQKAVEEFRSYARSRYGMELYLVTVQQNNIIPPDVYGYDAALETAPNFRSEKSLLPKRKYPKLAEDVKLTIYDYLTNAFLYIFRQEKYKLFRCCYPMWDNCPRRKKKGSWMFLGSSPQLFEKFLAEQTIRTARTLDEKEQFIFINAWNEWGEGAHLEPDLKYGYDNLKVVKRVFEQSKVAGGGKPLAFSAFEKLKMWWKLEAKFVKKVKIGNVRYVKLLGITILKYTKDKR